MNEMDKISFGENNIKVKTFKVTERIEIKRYIANNFVNERVGLVIDGKEHLFDALTAYELYKTLGKSLEN